MSLALDVAGGPLTLGDWRRRIGELYVDVRTMAKADPGAAWEHWRAERERLFREHPQSPVPAAVRSEFRAHHWPYDPAWRFEVEVEPPPAEPVSPFGALRLPNSGPDVLSFRRVGLVRLPFADRERSLSVYWIEGYEGGVFVPFRDATNGGDTYGAGRYVVDGAKGADLGGDLATRTIVLDLNFAYHPSCAFDPRWACPLAGPDDRLDISVTAGERLR